MIRLNATEAIPVLRSIANDQTSMEPSDVAAALRQAADHIQMAIWERQFVARALELAVEAIDAGYGAAHTRRMLAQLQARTP